MRVLKYLAMIVLVCVGISFLDYMIGESVPVEEYSPQSYIVVFTDEDGGTRTKMYTADSIPNLEVEARKMFVHLKKNGVEKVMIVDSEGNYGKSHN